MLPSHMQLQYENMYIRYAYTNFRGRKKRGSKPPPINEKEDFQEATQLRRRCRASPHTQDEKQESGAKKMNLLPISAITYVALINSISNDIRNKHMHPIS